MTIVVMGGSFNPPTIAHKGILLAAVDQLKADLGIFVPASGKYLRRKMRKAGCPEEVFSDETRLAMLTSVASSDPRLKVEDVELHHTKNWYTLETLRYLKGKYPDAEIYCLIGSDKLPVFAGAHRVREFLAEFHYAVVIRGEEDPMAVLRAYPDAWAMADRFSVIEAPVGIGEVSSTTVRELLRSGKPGLEALVEPEVLERLKGDALWLSEIHPA